MLVGILSTIVVSVFLKKTMAYKKFGFVRKFCFNSSSHRSFLRARRPLLSPYLRPVSKWLPSHWNRSSRRNLSCPSIFSSHRIRSLSRLSLRPSLSQWISIRRQSNFRFRSGLGCSWHPRLKRKVDRLCRLRNWNDSLSYRSLCPSSS